MKNANKIKIKQSGHTRSEVQKRIDAIAALKAEIDWLLKYQNVTVISGYNGQPYGRSQKSLTGQIVTIDRTSLTEWMGPKIHIFISDRRYRCGMDLDEVMFGDEVSE